MKNIQIRNPGNEKMLCLVSFTEKYTIVQLQNASISNTTKKCTTLRLLRSNSTILNVRI